MSGKQNKERPHGMTAAMVREYLKIMREETREIRRARREKKAAAK